MLCANRVCVYVGQKYLLHDITLALQPATIYGLVGKNGAGKSTLLQVLSGAIAPSLGAVQLDQKPLLDYKIKARAQKIAYLPQNLPDVPQISVWDFVLFGRYPHQMFWQKPSKQDQQITQQALLDTDMLPFAQSALQTLSGGEKARAYLALCLAQGAPYLLLDEPLAALDVQYQVQILQTLRNLVQKNRLTVLFSVHDINLAARFCDQIIALKNGTLAYCGLSDDFMCSSVLQQVFDVPAHIVLHPVLGKKLAVF